LQSHDVETRWRLAATTMTAATADMHALTSPEKNNKTKCQLAIGDQAR
jgi:hypothetical protein